jgi:hypothetical protein
MKAPYVVHFRLAINDWLSKWGKVSIGKATERIGFSRHSAHGIFYCP